VADRRRVWEDNALKASAIAVEVFDGKVTVGIHNDVPPFGAWRLVDLPRDEVVTLVSALSRWLDEHPASL
jgi:hypothetical protein